MALLLAGRHPDKFAAVSAWVGITDLARWHNQHAGDDYGASLRACCGGKPGESKRVDREYRARSPLTWLAGARDLPVELAAGIYDGHLGSVSIDHTLNAFNLLAAENDVPPIDDATMHQLMTLSMNDLPHLTEDPDLGRKIYLRRQAGLARVTIFEGQHEMVPQAAIAWLSRFPGSKRSESGIE